MTDEERKQQLDDAWFHYSDLLLDYQNFSHTFMNETHPIRTRVASLKAAKARADVALLDYWALYDEDQRLRFPGYFTLELDYGQMG